MNSDGLAQLAFDKGIIVLAASQSMESAIEVDQLGHGLLTYALVQEEFSREKGRRAETEMYSSRRWLDYAVGEFHTDNLNGIKGRVITRNSG